jgi:hypothetical protein
MLIVRQSMNQLIFSVPDYELLVQTGHLRAAFLPMCFLVNSFSLIFFFTSRRFMIYFMNVLAEIRCFFLFMFFI